ncbi:KpsF/GutQ family sugar-phosphate isomerase [Roseiconus lacunae]|uniref:KpsF/GutQ family sugar-phosphate isomerase n=1 Tax=Roseiconus lacunae TaxID=2605694 RepID=UPI001E457657|nr:KpsF/GutQ family sugar-phosphate isomerase [Roseiconus lacunae]MCD0460922.1 KpsF/GutQ family sugar-phosphate isomerase [Roseiconus lacunae]
MSAVPQKQGFDATETAAQAGRGGHHTAAPETLIERLRMIRQFVSTEANALQSAAKNLGPSAVQAAELTAECQGNIVVTGVGKAGLVGQKLVATLASTGTPAHFLHPTEAVHGDFGRVRSDDLVWAISNSGRSDEVLAIASQLRRQSTGLISITADEDNPLAKTATCKVAYGKQPEACPHGLAPTSSTAAMMAVGDAIALMASQLRRFTATDFRRFHPGGALGRKLDRVEKLMRPLESCRLAKDSVSIRECMVTCSISGRRSGAIMLTNTDNVLTGIFTDSDLARLLESRCEDALDGPIGDKMTIDPHCVSPETMASDAISLLSQLRISELPVVDAMRRPVGMIDITDLIALGEIADSTSSHDPQMRPIVPFKL